MDAIHVNVPALVREVRQQLPSALSEPFLRETWAGTYGRLGLTSDIDHVASHADLGEDSLTGWASVAGTIDQPGGEPAGSLTRQVKLQQNGRLSVDHVSLQLKNSVHRSGFASDLNNKALGRYEAAGIDDVTVEAAHDGGYVWARTGFELAPGANDVDGAARAVSRARKVRSLVESSFKRQRLTTEEFATLQPRLIGDDGVIRPDTLTGVRELAAIDGLGEHALKGQLWNGMRPLQTNGGWWNSPAGRAGVADATESTAYLRALHDEADGMRDARHAVSALMPEALEPTRMSAKLEQATAGGSLRLLRTGEATTRFDLIRHTVSTDLPMRIVDGAGNDVGAVDFRMRVGEDGLITARRRYDRSFKDSGSINGVVPDTLRGAGVAFLDDPRAGMRSLDLRQL